MSSNPSSIVEIFQPGHCHPYRYIASVVENIPVELNADNLKTGGGPNTSWHVLCHQDERCANSSRHLRTFLDESGGPTHPQTNIAIPRASEI